MSIKFVFLLLLLSLHSSCNARILGVSHNDLAKDLLHHHSINKENNEKMNQVGGSYEEKSVKNHGGGDDDERSSQKMRVRQRKRGEEEPGFNLDYLPPKTHPPVHN